MANTTIALSDTVLNYSGQLSATFNPDTRLLDFIFDIGSKVDTYATGRKKVNAYEFALSSNYDLGTPTQPAISETASLTAPTAVSITRDQQTNVIQIFQEKVSVSYLKSSGTGQMSGINVMGQENNVPDEFDKQASWAMQRIKRNLNYTLINGTYAKSTGNTVAYKTRGLLAGITTNVVEVETSAFNANTIEDAITDAIENGFQFIEGSTVLMVNPKDQKMVNAVYSLESGFTLPSTRVEGGISISSIVTLYGNLAVSYDKDIPVGNMMILNFNQLAITELDTAKGNLFFEPLAKVGASDDGQIYGQMGLDYGAEQQHILIKITEDDD